MAIEVTWYLTHITRPNGTTTTWSTQTSTRVDVWFGTQAEFNATHPTGYDLVIIDEADGALNQVDGDELRIALHQYNSSFNLSTNAGYLGTFDVDYTANGVTNPDPTVAFAVDGRGIESSRDAYLITLEPVTVRTFTAEYKGGTSHFHPFFPASLTPCFAAGTLLLTDRGARAVETLKPGDLVQTRDHGLVPLRLALVSAVSPGQLRRTPALQPIRIGKDALGQGMPSQDLVVSPQHRVLVRSRIARQMFDADEVLVAAHQLVDHPGISVASDLNGVTYFHLVFDRHEILTSNGAETESFYPGPEGLRALSPAALAEFAALFPAFAGGAADCVAPPAAARPFATGHKARQMVRRHEANAVRLCA